MNGSNPTVRTVRAYLPGGRNWTEEFPSPAVARSRISPVPWLLMTTAARRTSAPLGSLTVPAIAPVSAVWPRIDREQSANMAVQSKVRDACNDMFLRHLVPPTITTPDGRKNLVQWRRTNLFT